MSQLAEQPIRQISPTELEQLLKTFAEDMSRNMAGVIATLPAANSITSLDDILSPALELLGPVVKYVEENPWVLIPLLIPALEAWLTIIGFEAGGVAAGTIAAMIQSHIGNVPKGSLFAFLTSNGAGGFGRVAFRTAQRFVVIAVVLAAVGKLLLHMDNGQISGKVTTVLETVWNHTTHGLGGNKAGGESDMLLAAMDWLGAKVVSASAWLQL